MKSLVDVTTPDGDSAFGNQLNNLLINGDFSCWQRGVGPVSAPNGSRTYLADRFWVQPFSANLSLSQSTSTFLGSVCKYSLQIGGASGTSLTSICIQRVESSEVQKFARQITISAWMYNASGAAYTPTLLIGTPAAGDDFTTITNRLSANLQSCANNAWTQVSITLDISLYTNIANGIQFEIQIPGVALNNSAYIQRIMQVSIVPGPRIGTFTRKSIGQELASCYRYYQNVRISVDFAAAGGSEVMASPVPYKSTMFKQPTIAAYNTPQDNNVASVNYNGISAEGAGVQITSTSVGRTYYYGALSLDAEIT